MSYKMAVEKDPGCIVFRFYKISSTYQVDDVLQEILQIHRKQGISTVLCDVSQAEDSLGMFDLYQIGVKLTTQEFRRVNVAVFSSDTHLGVEFTSAVAIKGGGNLKTFTCERAAREWLFQNKE